MQRLSSFLLQMRWVMAQISETLDAAINHLEMLPAEERNQWEKLMYYLVLLIYHR